MTFIPALAGAAVALITVHFLTGKILPSLKRLGLRDIPNERSSHVETTLRGGGAAVVVGLLTGGLLWSLATGSTVLLPLFAIITFFALLGLLDDLRSGLPVRWRFVAQLVIAAVATWWMGPVRSLPLPTPLDIPIGEVLSRIMTVIWIVAAVNITNFLDGIDGYAAAQGLWTGFGVAVYGHACGSASTFFLGLLLAGSSAGFLPWNWSPARVFLGDVGSYAIGACIALAALTGKDRGDTMLAMAMLSWAFLGDGTLTLFKRLSKKERIWSPHREHLYQQLVQGGRSHSTVVVGMLTSAAPVGILGVAGLALEWPLLAWGGLLAGGLWIVVTCNLAQRKRRVTPTTS